MIIPEDLGAYQNRSQVRPRQQVQKLELSRENNGKRVVLAVTPETVPLGGITDLATYASSLRLEFTVQGCNTQRKSVEFPVPVIVTNGSILMQVPRGRDRLGRPQELQTFDPWVVFGGSKEDRSAVKGYKALGVKFI